MRSARSLSSLCASLLLCAAPVLAADRPAAWVQARYDGWYGQKRKPHYGTVLAAGRPLYIHADGEIYTGFGSNLRNVTLEVQAGALRVVRGKPTA